MNKFLNFLSGKIGRKESVAAQSKDEFLRGLWEKTESPHEESDLTLLMADGTRFYVHKLVVNQYPVFFKSALNFKESQETEAVIDFSFSGHEDVGANSETIREAIRFIYLGEINELAIQSEDEFDAAFDEIENRFKLAEFLHIDDYEAKCDAVFENSVGCYTNVKLPTILLAIKLADKFRLPLTEDGSVCTIVANFKLSADQYSGLPDRAKFLLYGVNWDRKDELGSELLELPPRRPITAMDTASILNYQRQNFGTVSMAPSTPTTNSAGTGRKQNYKGKKPAGKQETYCKFCFNNERSKRERHQLATITPNQLGSWRSHPTKDDTGSVHPLCPLYRHICELCGATGPQAHTDRYCPKKNQQQREEALLMDAEMQERRRSN